MFFVSQRTIKLFLVQATDQTTQALEQIKRTRPGALNGKLPMLHV
jgi:hypothetical protein